MQDRQNKRWSGTRFVLACLLFLAGGRIVMPADTASMHVKFILQNEVYLQTGEGIALSEGQRLTIGRTTEDDALPVVVAEVEIESVASTSAAGRIISSNMQVIPGDLAYLSREDMKQSGQSPASPQAEKKDSTAGTSANGVNQTPAGGNGAWTPKSQANRIRGRLGVDYSAMQIPNSGVGSSQFGFMLRMDATRLAGTYWSVKGYYRGRVQSRKNSVQQTTLTDLINRTYHLSVQYENPASNWVAGGGRLYVPWASSLSTIDGFYFGRRLGRQTVVGVFGGTTPDPSSWNYDPEGKLGGAFINIERGSFEAFRLSSTAGVALSRVGWDPDRQFGFFENGFFYKRYLSVYNNMEVDLRTESQNEGKQEILLSRSYTTFRVQPHKRVSFDINQNYFRNYPSFDPRLIGTGLVDKFLFQGVSGGFRLTLPYGLGITGNTGRSSRTGDQQASWNYLGSAALNNILHSGIRAEYRFSRFNSSFGSGTYQSGGISREVGEDFHFNVQGGRQSLNSVYSAQTRSHFVNANVDWYLKANYFLGAGLTIYRGQGQDYNQFFASAGYRFDTHR